MREIEGDLLERNGLRRLWSTGRDAVGLHRTDGAGLVESGAAVRVEMRSRTRQQEGDRSEQGKRAAAESHLGEERTPLFQVRNEDSMKERSARSQGAPPGIRAEICDGGPPDPCLVWHCAANIGAVI